MRSIVTVTSAATSNKLTTTARVKQELSITSAEHDELLGRKIDEASSDIQAYLNFNLARETVEQTFWLEDFDDMPAALLLDRTPIASITSVTVDGVAIDSSYYRYDAKTGELFKLDESGYPCRWLFCKSVIVVHVGGYILPGQDGANLEPAIESAAISLVTLFWLEKGRDQSVKSVEIPGVIRTDYWVGSVGEEGELPPGVVSKIARFRRAAI